MIDSTVELPRISQPSELEIEFVIPSERDPWELPWEMNLDNLLRGLLEALEGTILRVGPGEGAAVVRIGARLRVARRREKTGVHLLIHKSRKRS